MQTNASKDVLIIWNDIGGDVTDIYKNTYSRAANTWSGPTLARDTTPNTNIHNLAFIRSTKYTFFMGDDGADRNVYMMDDLLEVSYQGAATFQGVGTFSGTASFTLLGATTFPRPLIEVAFATDPTSEIPIWTNITEWVEQFNVRRGRQRELDRFEPGTASLTLDNDDRRFDPSNGSGPYYPNVLPVRRVRIRAIYNNVIYDIFNGYAGGWPQDYPTKHLNKVTLDCTDAMGVLSFAEVTLSRPEETSGSRISAILNEADWPASDRDLDVGEEMLAAEELSGSALQLIQDVAVTELGRVFTSKDGKVTFHGHDRLFNPPTVLGVWGDDDVDPTEHSYESLVPSQDEGEIYNRVTVTRTGGEPQVAEDAISQSMFFLRDLPESNLPLVSDTAAEARSQFQLVRYKDPQLRFDSMAVLPYTDDTFAEVLEVGIGDLVEVHRFHGSTDPIEKVVYVDGMEHDVNRDDKSWVTTFKLTPELDDSGGYWLLGTSALGVDTKLAL